MVRGQFLREASPTIPHTDCVVITPRNVPFYDIHETRFTHSTMAVCYAELVALNRCVSTMSSRHRATLDLASITYSNCFKAFYLDT